MTNNQTPKRQPKQPMPTHDKPIPADVHAERCLLSVMMSDGETALKAINRLEEFGLWETIPSLYAGGHTFSMFYLEKHHLIYQAIKALVDRRVAPTIQTVVIELNRGDRIELVGGIQYLIEISAVGFPFQVGEYLDAVVNMAQLRRTISFGAEVAALGYNSELTNEELIELINQKYTALTMTAQSRDVVSLAQLSDLYYKELNQIAELGGPIAGVKTGFTDLDMLLGGGLQRSDLILLAARPATGKTSLMLNLAINAAKEKYRGVIFSLEMSREQLLQRMIATESGIDMQRVRGGTIRDGELEALARVLGEFSELPLFIDDSPGITLARLRAKVLKLHALESLDFILIDYLQLMRGSGQRDQNRQAEISEISRGLKELAKEVNVPILALSQLSRAVESRSGNIPMLSDLRESGSLEQDADIVMFIYREELYDPETDKKGIAELHIAKHRNGPTGLVPLRFFRSTTKFDNLETYREAEGY